jgi:hypothetical protein
MQTTLIVIAIYAIGFWLAYAIAVYQISKFNTRENPLIPAVLSWITVLMVLAVFLFRPSKEK